ncbi:MAG TPA: hypothetical protein VM238_18595 [Phycisphaerae bacterium]|nr:hypothetical protein [Phycisphaerae bacterium]
MPGITKSQLAAAHEGLPIDLPTAHAWIKELRAEVERLQGKINGFSEEAVEFNAGYNAYEDGKSDADEPPDTMHDCWLSGYAWAAYRPLKAENVKLQKKAEQLDRMPLCPDHRDKFHGGDCLACEVERLQGLVRRLRIAILDLLDEQNGVPLLTRETEYNEVVKSARDAAEAAGWIVAYIDGLGMLSRVENIGPDDDDPPLELDSRGRIKLCGEEDDDA